MTDPRNPSYTVYTQSDLALMGILKNICAVKTMRSMEEQFNEEICIDTLRILSGDEKLEEMPHCDTLNYYLEKLSSKCLAEVRKQMLRHVMYYGNIDIDIVYIIWVKNVYKVKLRNFGIK